MSRLTRPSKNNVWTNLSVVYQGNIDYKKNTISGGGMTTTSTFSSFSSSTVFVNGSNATPVTTPERNGVIVPQK